GLFIGTARAGDAADGAAAVFLLDAAEFRGGIGNGFVPGDFAPWIGDRLADHRLGDAFLVGRVTPGEAALHAGMAVIGFAVLVGGHAHHAVALQLRLEGAADTAIGAGGDDRTFRRAVLDNALFHQRRGRAGLHAGATGDAFGIQEILVHAGGDMRGEAALVDGQGEGALHFLAGAHAARAHDAFRRIEGEIGIGLVLRDAEVVFAVIAV